MIAEITAVQQLAGQAKAAVDVVKGLISLQVTTETQATVFEVQKRLLDMQSLAMQARDEQSALQQRVHELEAALAKRDDWEREKKRYKLRQVSRGVYVYVVAKSELQPGEPPHSICPSCFEHGQKSVLQIARLAYRPFQCPSCKTVYEMDPVTDGAE